jgi:hypothetical protein
MIANQLSDLVIFCNHRGLDRGKVIVWNICEYFCAPRPINRRGCFGAYIDCLRIQCISNKKLCLVRCFYGNRSGGEGI